MNGDSCVCPDCGGNLVDMYASDFRVSYPVRICSGCSSLWIGEDKTELPKDWEKKYTNVAISAKSAADSVIEEIKQDPEFRTRQYFERVFKWAFSEGFSRAYAIFRSRFKEGRYKRIRELWAKVETSNKELPGLTAKEYTEISRLINFGRK